MVEMQEVLDLQVVVEVLVQLQSQLLITKLSPLQLVLAEVVVQETALAMLQTGTELFPITEQVSLDPQELLLVFVLVRMETLMVAAAVVAAAVIMLAQVV
jgi:hypothetical protein